LKYELKVVQSERDAMAEEILKLNAQVAAREKERAEYDEMKRRLLEYEGQRLDRSDDVIRSRDRMIVELSSKLERSLDQLEMERTQQRLRRQIIFPAVPPTSSPAAA
jgi:hypothetical protein